MKPSGERLTRALREYFGEHGRDLPWRRTKDPYAILISELMLQQTQVSRVIPKWHAWLLQFPNLRSLAESKPADVLRLWSGLGYNSRALRLRELAIVVMKEWGGKIPKEPEQLLTLPGIGPYTANAVASFAFGRDVLALDTNLKRVLGRYFGKKDATFSVPTGMGPLVNGALMDIGASVCGRTPQCAVCPLRDACATKGRARFEVAKKAAQKFEESDRCVRGSVLKSLLSGPRTPKSLQKLASERCVNVTSERLTKILRALERGGLVRTSGTKISII